MSHLAFSETDVEAEADVIVVGSGAGGASIAVHLARAGVRVLVVEAGAWRSGSDLPSSAYGSMRDLLDNWASNLTMGRAGWPIVQARTVGGTTVINSAICVRTPADVFARWQAETGVGGGLADRVWAHQDVLERELSVQEVPAGAFGRSNTLATEAATALGWHDHAMRRYVAGCAGSGQCIQGCRALRKQSVDVVFLPEVRARSGVVWSNAPVDQVIFERGRAVGVRGRFRDPTGRRGGRFVARAPRVVVAASATHGPALLRRSGLRGAVGSGFRAHPGSGVIGLYDDPVDMNTGATQGWASMVMRDTPGLKLETLALPLDMLASRFPGFGAAWVRQIAQYRYAAHWVHAVRAESVGRVWSGPFGQPVVWYGLDKADMVRMRDGVYAVARLHVAAGARAVMPGVAGVPGVIDRDNVGILADGPLDPRAYTGILSHLFGGAPMGADPRASACGVDGAVHGVEGLFVADASMIPSNLGVNPQHTIMALARCVGDGILARA